jgi:hypothetical protein
MGDTEMVEMRLRWFGHMERKEDSDWVKACQWVEVSGKRGRGRDRKTWRECGGGCEGAWIEGGGCTGKTEVEEANTGDRLTRASMEETDIKPVILAIC